MSTQNAVIDITGYKIINKIGEGSYSTVYRVKEKKTAKYYSAKVSKFMIDEVTKNSPESLSLFREVNLMSLLDHPSVLKFICYYPTNFNGDPLPTIITELALNGSLRDIINMESRGLAPSEWNHTKKLINIYGIATSISYLHSHNILHRDLKPENILIDEYLNPKISDFGLSKITDFLSTSMNVESLRGIKGTPAYMAPEILLDKKPSKSSDVYAFGLIVYEIMTCEKPFENIHIFDLFNKIVNEGYRPPIKDDVPSSYKELIERCWSQDAESRPSFDQIVSELKTNDEFITDLIDVSEFYDYVEFIDNYEITFDATKQVIHFEDFIKQKGRNKNVKPILFNCSYSIINDDEESKNTSNESDESNKQDLMYPLEEFNNLSKNNQNLVEEAEKDSEKRYEVGRFLIEGKNDFPKNIDLGIQYIEHSVNDKCVNATFYYIELLIKGTIIKENLHKAKEFLMKLNSSDYTRIFFIKGQIKYKKSKFTKAAKFYKEGSKLGNSLCMYKYGKMNFLGEGTTRNIKKAIKYFTKSKDQGLEKSGYFIESFNTFNNYKKFSKLPPETQLIFIKNNIKNKENKRDSEILLTPKNTELVFFNKSLKSTNFYELLAQYNDISIEINYPSKSFKAIIDLVIKVRKEYLEKLKIGVVFTNEYFSFSSQFTNECFSKDISYHKIDSTIQIIPSKAFNNCKLLTRINIPSSVTSIGNSVFEGCSSLKQIIFEIPSSVTSFGNSTFNGCSKLTEITIPSSVTSIGNSAFSGCSKLAEITIPSSVTSIGDSVFSNCISLRQITIPSSVTSIGSSSFKKCSDLEHITIPSSVTQIGNSTFNECSKLKQITIPSSVTQIGDYTFYYCMSLTQITIPSSVTLIGDYSFNGCSKLTQITIPSSVTSIGNYAFSGCSSLTQIIIPSSVTSIKNNTFSYCKSLNKISIPFSVNSIEEYAFSGCLSLTQIEIPSSVTSINDYAFLGCSLLAQITIPSSVTEIGKCVFNEIKKIEIKGDIKSIPNNLFSYCKSLAHIKIPSSITSIGNNAFYECSSLTRITIPSSVTSIGEGAFFRCSLLTQISFEIPSSVTKIGDYAFYECSSLTLISIPSSVTSIGNNAFYECLSLTQITIPSSVTSIGEGAFNACSSLTQVTIPSSLTTNKIRFNSNVQIKVISLF